MDKLSCAAEDNTQDEHQRLMLQRGLNLTRRGTQLQVPYIGREASTHDLLSLMIGVYCFYKYVLMIMMIS